MTLEDQGKLQQRVFAQRLPLFTALVTLVFSLLVLRLYYLQIVRGRHYSRLAEENRISLIRVRAPRGIVFDRHGNVLVTNRPSFSVSLDLNAVRDLDATVGAVAAALGLDRAELARKVRAVEPYRRFEPVRVKDDVDRSEVAALEALRYEYPGVLVEVEPRRSYPHGTLASHVLGYVGQISAAELKARADLGYRMGDSIGKMGIEKELDAELKGRDGFQQMEVDSLGRGIKVLSSIPPLPGHSVTLTIDLALQQVAEEVLAGIAGADRGDRPARRQRACRGEQSRDRPEHLQPRPEPGGVGSAQPRRAPPAAEPHRPGAVPPGVGLQDTDRRRRARVGGDHDGHQLFLPGRDALRQPRFPLLEERGARRGLAAPRPRRILRRVFLSGGPQDRHR